MRIGIDMDGVLTDLTRFVTDYGIKFCYENHIKYEIHPKEYNEASALGVSEENANKFWNRYLPYYATEYPAREFASEVIKKLKEHNEIYIVTARNEDGLPQELHGKMKEFVNAWLEKNEIQYDEIIYTKGSKLPFCLNNNIDIMIEDAPMNIKEISTKIPVLCFDNPYNKEIEGENITRVYSWYDVLRSVDKRDTPVCPRN